MIAVISPAKTLDFTPQSVTTKATQPVFTVEAAELAALLKGYSPARLAKLMSINPKLAQLNFERYQEWSLPFTAQNAKQALFCFKGDVFLGIDATTLNAEDADFAQGTLRILSGLYGVLRPLDLMQPYRLEMGSPLKVKRRKDLYQFWGNKIAEAVMGAVEQSADKVVVNLASKEYFKVLEGRIDDVRVITPVFKDFKNGEYRFIHVFGKKARGLMTRFIIDRRIQDPEEMKLFDYEGYFYNDRMSGGDEWVFTRG
jgi:cytoplasmic iron level regulating protein YaaA (DUF328/UPF0246 family)